MPTYRHKCDCCGEVYENEHMDFSKTSCKKCGMNGIRRDWSYAPAVSSVSGAGGSKAKPSGKRKGK